MFAHARRCHLVGLQARGLELAPVRVALRIVISSLRSIENDGVTILRLGPAVKFISENPENQFLPVRLHPFHLSPPGAIRSGYRLTRKKNNAQKGEERAEQTSEFFHIQSFEV